MARLDDDAARLLTLLGAAGAVDITTRQPAELRAYYANFPTMAGPDVHEVRDLMVAGAEGEIPARLYRPSAATGLPALVWFHGGGMVLGDLRGADWVCRSLCAQAGTAVVSVDYRLAPEHKFPSAPEDAYAALCWVAEQADALGIDAARISVGGDSAGGTLSAVCCLLARDRGGPAVRAQLLVYPGTDRDLTRPSVSEFADGPILTRSAMLWFRGHTHTSEDELGDLRASPALAPSHAGLPQAFVVTAEVDPLRDAGEAYAGVLARAGVLTTAKRYNGVYHGFFTMGASMAKTREAVADAARFLRVS
jgi:acetyl esterase